MALAQQKNEAGFTKSDVILSHATQPMAVQLSNKGVGIPILALNISFNSCATGSIDQGK